MFKWNSTKVNDVKLPGYLYNLNAIKWTVCDGSICRHRVYSQSQEKYVNQLDMLGLWGRTRVIILFIVNKIVEELKIEQNFLLKVTI